MKYRSVPIIIILCMFLIVLPVSAGLKKIDSKAPVFVGEIGIDISSALNGCSQIAWWPPGNTTDTPPGKVLDIKGDMYRYNITPGDFYGYDGWWYSYDKKPSYKVFEVVSPQFDLKVWDLDNNRDVTGQAVPANMRINYQIETNLYKALDPIKRPDMNPLDLFVDVALSGPNAKPISQFFTGNMGLPDTQILKFDSKPFIKSSPYQGKNGGSWNRSARGVDGTTPIYPPGTYTFVAVQNLNNMADFFGEKEGVTTSGKKTFVSVADAPVTVMPTTGIITVLPTQPVTQAPTVPATIVQTVVQTPVQKTPSVKPTWTSTPLSTGTTVLSLLAVFLLSVSMIRKRT